MSNQELNKQKSEQGRKTTVNIAIIVALIGLCGAIISALISTYKISFEENISTITPVSTASRFPNATLISQFVTFTSLPTVSLYPPIPLGQDWLAGCISTLWQAYPSSIIPVERGDGCWQEPLHAYSAENGDLDFFYERKGGQPEIYGLFTLLPEKGTVTFTVRLRDLHNADLWMGVYDSPDLDSQGLLMAILNGPVEKRSIIQKDPHTYETLQGSVALAQENGYSITFTFDSLYVSSRVNPAIFVVNPASIPSSKKWLFLGYKGLNGSYRIDGTFLSFELKH